MIPQTRPEILCHKVLGSISELPLWAELFKADTAIIAIPSASADAQRRAATMCVRVGVKELVLPALTVLKQG
jgi:FlaA1/EpsC-like NDP-sugar epimerase